MTGTDSHEMVVPLIGAWALDACPPAQEQLVRAHLSRCATCAREARALRETAAELAGEHLRPPAGVAARLRAAAHDRRRPAAAAPEHAVPYAAQVAALDLLLSGLHPEHWRRVAAYGTWTVHDLLAHLAATDSLLADGLGLAVRPSIEPGTRPEARTAAVLDLERRRSVEQTRRAWRTQADAVCGALLRDPSLAARSVTLGLPMPVPDALMFRAFETWIHTEDIATATGRPTVPPLPEHLHPMADLAARTLPHLTAQRVAKPDGRYVRLHLTGAGGGTWTVPLTATGPTGPGARPVAVVLTVDIIEFCRLAADRRDPERVTVDIRGDIALAREVLAVVPAMAVP